MDSPLSEPDSLSSAGATTEPLPNSEADDLQLSSSPAPARRSRSRSLHAPAHDGGAESDSSLTEQSDSEAEPSATGAEDMDEAEEAPGGAASELGDDEQEEDDEEEEDEPVQHTPRGQKRPRPIVNDEDEDEASTAGHARKRVGVHAASDDDELSSASDDAADADHRPRTKIVPAPKRPRADGEDSVASSSTVDALAQPRQTGSTADSLSELDDDDLASQPTPKPHSTATADDDDELASASETPATAAAPAASPKGKKGARGRGNGRPRGLGARGRPRAVAKPATARSESPLSAVSSSSLAVDRNGDSPMAVAASTGSGEQGAAERAGAAADTTESDAAAIKELEDEANAVETLAAGTAVAGGASTAARTTTRGRGRGRGKGKGRGAGRGGDSAMERSTSHESSGEPHKHFGNGTSPSNSAFSLPALPAPSGLVELETAPAALANQLVELAEAEADVAAGAALRSGSGEGGGAAGEGSVAPMEGVDAPAEPVDDRAEMAVDDVEVEVEEDRPAPPPSTKKGAAGKKGGKKGKGKEKALPPPPAEADGQGDDEEPLEGEEEEDASDDAFMRKRAEAMEALTKIEISFARLRDLLYLERLADIEKERLAIETGAHPELIHLTQLIELRRNRKLELARLWLDGLEGAYQIQFTDRQHANWNSWQDDRARERTRMLDEANSKRRRLEREKRALERPKDDSLASMLAPRPPPAVPLHHRRRLGFDGEPLAENEITWALRHPDVRVDASVRGLDDEAMYGDLERMGLREPIRHPLYPYDAVYAHAPGLGGPSYGDPRAAQLGYPYGGGYDGGNLAMQQQQAFPTAFGSLPPLPQHQRVESGPPRPPSNPRLAQGFPAELGGGQPGYPAASRAYAGGHYPQTYAEIEAWQHQRTGYGGLEDEQRRRTISAGGSFGAHRSHESLDAVAAHRQNGYTPAASTGAGQEGDPTGGRTTPTPASAAAKARFTLDEHMNTRSPKGPASSSSVASSATKAPVSSAATATAAASSAAAAAARSPAPFMSIPAIPPFDRNRHEQTIRARAAAAAGPTASSPAPPVIPPFKPHPTPTAAPLFTSAQPQQQQQQQQQQAATSQAQSQGSFPAYAVPQRAA